MPRLARSIRKRRTYRRPLSLRPTFNCRLRWQFLKRRQYRDLGQRCQRNRLRLNRRRPQHHLNGLPLKRRARLRATTTQNSRLLVQRTCRTVLCKKWLRYRRATAAIFRPAPAPTNRSEHRIVPTNRSKAHGASAGNRLCNGPHATKGTNRTAANGAEMPTRRTSIVRRWGAGSMTMTMRPWRTSMMNPTRSSFVAWAGVGNLHSALGCVRQQFLQLLLVEFGVTGRQVT